MEYLQKCFYRATGWNEDNIFSHLTATSQAILDFPIPNGLKVDVSSKSSDYLASSFTLSNNNSINGSIAYLYSSNPLLNTMGTKDILLQDAIAGFKIIEPSKKLQVLEKNYQNILLYGRMYFPGSALEAMIIKRINQSTQLLVKCINNPNVDSSGTMIFYLQKNSPKFLREFIYSTNQSLFGFRCLYNFNIDTINNIKSSTINSSDNIPKFDNSVMSLGTEIWYAARTLSPGLSTTFRYSTRSTSTGKPLTMTLACNPILGHISSTYTVKTSVSSSFCSKYDFNVYSYASNLSLGFELFNFSKNYEKPNNNNNNNNNDHDHNQTTLKPSLNPDNRIINPIQDSDNYFRINPNLLPNSTANVSIEFQNLVNESNFSSVIKSSVSIQDKVFKILWEGRLKDFLVSTGVKVGLNPLTSTPEFNRFGISCSYAA